MFITFEEVDTDELYIVNADNVAVVNLDLSPVRAARVLLTFVGATPARHAVYFGPADMSERELEIRTNTLKGLLGGAMNANGWTKEEDAQFRAAGALLQR